MAGMKGALAHDVGPNQLTMLVLVRVQVDDEIMHIGGGVGRPGPGGTTTFQVRRGMEGTTAVSHAVGAEFVFLPPLIPPDIEEEFAVEYLQTAQVRNPRYRYPKGRS